MFIAGLHSFIAWNLDCCKLSPLQTDTPAKAVRVTFVIVPAAMVFILQRHFLP